jgi:ubiquinone/menaquinone biosynthesis C-methylase UbiE
MDPISTYYNKPSVTYGVSNQRKRSIIDLCGEVAGKKILDIGCGSGELGRDLKKRGAVVMGVDISEASVRRAQKVLDQVFLLNLEADQLPFGGDLFDVVILSEVIEHLFFPEKLIEKLKKFMKPDSFVVITTPNFLVFSNRIKMLFGKFEYAETGFFDRGHIHFFTWESLNKMLVDLGLEVVSHLNIFHPKSPPFLKTFFLNLFTYQAVVKAKLKPPYE